VAAIVQRLFFYRKCFLGLCLYRVAHINIITGFFAVQHHAGLFFAQMWGVFRAFDHHPLACAGQSQGQ